MNIKDMLSVGYAYEFASTLIDGVPDGTHEIQLKINLGKSREFTRKVKVEEGGNRDARFYSDAPVTFIDAPLSQQSPDESAPTHTNTLDLNTYYHDEMAPGHYVILKKYDSFADAYQYWSGIVSRYGYKASFGYSSRDDIYYVFLFNSEDQTKTQVELDKTKLLELFDDAYSLEID
jgi:hypothetical protein